MIPTIAGRGRTKHVAPAINPSEWVYIVSSALNSLPSPGTRVGTSDASNMPVIQASTSNSAIKTADGAAKYRLVGIQVKAPTTLLQSAVVKIGGSETTLAEFPADIIIDRCLVRGDATVGLRRGVELDGIRCAVVDSYIYDVKENGADSQAVWAYNTPGPIKVVNNYLEATGENMMTGGQDPTYSNCVPSDIEIRKNHFKKLSAATWASSWDVKNLLEFKNAQRVLVEGNVFDTCYGDAQSGYGILITPRNQDGTASWCVTQDITIRYNYVTNVEAGFAIAGTDGNNTSQRSYRINVEHNLLEIVNQSQGGAFRVHQITQGPVDLQILNNTWVVLSGSSVSCGFHENSGTKADRTIWRNNVFDAGDYGIIGTGSSEGTSTFSTHFTNYTYSYNVMYRSPGGSGSYPSANNQFPSAATDVFTNYAGGDYTVKAAYQGDGSDGQDPGANITTLTAKKLHSIDGAWGSADNLYTDQAYTNAELPRSYVDTTYSIPTGGTTHVCTNASEFTTALANCASGDVIQLTAGNTFTGSFTLRAR